MNASNYTTPNSFKAKRKKREWDFKKIGVGESRLYDFNSYEEVQRAQTYLHVYASKGIIRKHFRSKIFPGNRMFVERLESELDR